MDKRFQVFVSSTYEDLQSERQEVMQALLELDCIPAGMELFPAANDSQWNFIKRIIGDCDYYVVIVAGRYGSLSPSGVGYTEMEYRYAEEIAKPTIAFLHRDPEQLPAKKTERSPEGQRRLQQFRGYVEQKLCKHWSSATELGSVVSRSLVQLIKANPGIGWVRGSDVGDPAESARLRTRIEELEMELAALASTGPKGTETLAQGTDRYTLDFSVSVYAADTYKTVGPGKCERSLTLTWDEIMRLGLPPLQQEGHEGNIVQRFNDLLQKREGLALLDPAGGPERGMNISLSTEHLQQILIQFRALGLIVPSVRKRSLQDKGRYWKLTPYGMTIMTRLCAIQHGTSA